MIIITDRETAKQYCGARDYFVINVAEVEENPKADVFIPFVAVSQVDFRLRFQTTFPKVHIPKCRLDAAAAMIKYGLDNNRTVVIHCTAGMERSPLAVMWYYHTIQGLTLNEAFLQVKLIRPEALDRRHWIKYESADDYLEHNEV